MEDRVAEGLPRWDITTIYPSLQSLEFERDLESLIRDIEDLRTLFDAHRIGQSDAPPLSPQTASNASTV